MSSIQQAFERAAAAGQAALIPYLMTAYPDPNGSVEMARTLERAGADLIELGMPFSDPLADGPTVQRAATASLRAGTTVSTCIRTAAEIRRSVAVPLVMMGYYNPIYRYGVQRFCEDAAAAGVDGLILPDLPPEEAGELLRHARRRGMDLIFLIAPTSTDERIRTAASAGSGFLYCVAVTGVTGARSSVSSDVAPFLARARQHTELPLAVGFGISTPENVRQVAAVADGVVVASALLQLAEQATPAERLERVEQYLRTLRAATDRPVAASG